MQSLTECISLTIDVCYSGLFVLYFHSKDTYIGYLTSLPNPIPCGGGFDCLHRSPASRR
jgi:hypothetical protein